MRNFPAKTPFIKLTTDPAEKILNITASQGATCALMTQSKAATTLMGGNSPFVKCWGYNENGALGAGDTVQHGLKPGTMGANLPRIDLALDDIVSLNAHWRFTCALSKSGRVKCWGVNPDGRLGLGDTKIRGALPSDMGKNLPDVELGLPAKAISTGSLSVHSCAILINNQIKCWGYGATGQLGYENDNNLGEMPGQMGDALPFVRFK